MSEVAEHIIFAIGGAEEPCWVKTGEELTFCPYAKDITQKEISSASIVLIAPSLVSYQLQLLTKSEKEAMQMARFALEDYIADEIENMHFVCSMIGENLWRVILTPISLMQDWMGLAEQGGWQLVDFVAGFDFDDWPSDIDAIKPVAFAIPENEKVAIAQMHILQANAPILKHEKAVASSVVDLRQGVFAPITDWLKILSPLKLMSILAVISFVIWCVLNIYTAWKYDAKATQFYDQAVANYKAVYPEKRIRNLKTQLRTAQPTGQGDQGQFLYFLSLIEPVLADIQILQIQFETEIDTGQGVLLLDVQFDNYDQLESFKREMQLAGFSYLESRNPRQVSIGNKLAYQGQVQLRQ